MNPFYCFSHWGVSEGNLGSSAEQWRACREGQVTMNSHTRPVCQPGSEEISPPGLYTVQYGLLGVSWPQARLIIAEEAL